MTRNELNEFFHMAQLSSPVSTDEVLNPEPNDAQKWQIWQELKAQEEMFRQDRSIIFLNYK